MVQLVVDTQTTGHHVEYVRHVVEWLSQQVDVVNHLLIAEEVADRLSLVDSANLRLHLSPGIDNSAGSKAFSKEAHNIARLCKKFGVDRLVLLNVNPYQKALLSKTFWNVDYIISGILFAPPHRIEAHEGDGISQRVKLGFKKYRKYLQLWAVTMNPSLQQLFVLDDEDGADQLNKALSCRKFFYLPDPIVTGESRAEDHVGTTNKNPILLLFGTITPRKNIERSIEAFYTANVPGSTLMIYGSGNPAYVDDLRSLCERLSNSDDISVIIENKFVSDEERDIAYQSATAVSLVYRHFYGSSGVLGHAARHLKPVIGPNRGLMAYLISKYSLGVTTEPQVSSMAEKYEAVLNSPETKSTAQGARDYLAAKTVEHFGRKLFERNK